MPDAKEELLDFLKVLGDADPDFKRQMDEAAERAQNGRKVIGKFVTSELKERLGMTIREVTYGLMFNAVMLAYSSAYGKRGVARDDLSELMDAVFELIEKAAIKSGANSVLSEAERLERKGDLAGARALLEGVTEAGGR